MVDEKTEEMVHDLTVKSDFLASTIRMISWSSERDRRAVMSVLLATGVKLVAEEVKTILQDFGEDKARETVSVFLLALQNSLNSKGIKSKLVASFLSEGKPCKAGRGRRGGKR